MSTPAYIETFHSGRLHDKAQEAKNALSPCHVCPQQCHVDRGRDEMGFCQTGRFAKVSSYFPHHGEEYVLRGRQGSGTIFFSSCNLKCQFCQNWEISHDNEGQCVSAEGLAHIALKLQDQGCHNINFVTPSYVVPQILDTLLIAIPQGLRVPLVCNSGGFDSFETLKLLQGVVDIYMPDFKFWSPQFSHKYLNNSRYPDVAKTAIAEMHRQVGPLEIDPLTGLARRGLLIRHLLMPGYGQDSSKIFDWIATRLSKSTYINIMDQYHPAGGVRDNQSFTKLQKRVTMEEFIKAINLARKAGLSRFDKEPSHFSYFN